MKDSVESLSFSSLFKMLGNSVIVEIIEELGRKNYSLPELRDKLGQSKPLLCMYLKTLHTHGLITKGKEDGRLHYQLRRRGLLSIIKHGKKFIGYS